jgi:hypothetical protein
MNFNMENQEQAQVAGTEGVGGEAPQAPAAQPELSIADLQNLKAIIDVAVKRGAFGAGEISAVGNVYDRLSAFLVAVTPAPAATPEQPVTQA